VAAISRSLFFGGRQVQMSLDTMSNLYGVHRDSALVIKARSKQDRKPLQTAVNGVLDDNYPQLRALTNTALQNDIDTRLKNELGLFNVLLFIAVYTSVFGLAATIAMSVLERTREIGVLRALGLTPRQVWGLVTAQTGIIGLLAGVLAVPSGLLLAAVLVFVINRRSFGWTMSIDPSPAILLQGVALSLVAALLAGLYPAWRMASAPPAEALRDE